MTSVATLLAWESKTLLCELWTPWRLAKAFKTLSGAAITSASLMSRVNKILLPSRSIRKGLVTCSNEKPHESDWLLSSLGRQAVHLDRVAAAARDVPPSCAALTVHRRVNAPSSGTAAHGCNSHTYTPVRKGARQASRDAGQALPMG